jgi:2'-5' RNA ligase
MFRHVDTITKYENTSEFDKKTNNSIKVVNVSNITSSSSTSFKKTPVSYGEIILDSKLGKNGSKYITAGEAKKIISWSEKEGLDTYDFRKYITAFRDYQMTGKSDITPRELIEFIISSTKRESSTSVSKSSVNNLSPGFIDANKLSWLELTLESKMKVQDLQEVLISAGIKQHSIVPTNDIHMTIAFLGKSVPYDILSQTPSCNQDTMVTLNHPKLFKNNLVLCSKVRDPFICKVHREQIRYAEKCGVKICTKDKNINEHITIARNLSENDKELAMNALSQVLNINNPLMLEGHVYVGYTSKTRVNGFAFRPVNNFVG